MPVVKYPDYYSFSWFKQSARNSAKFVEFLFFVLEIVLIEYIMLIIYIENADVLRIEFHKSLRIILSRR